MFDWRRFQAFLQSRALAILLLVTAGGGLSAWSSLGESATWDEPYAIASGYLQTQSNDFRLTPENPPLLGLVVSPALRLLGAEPPVLPGGSIAGRFVPRWGSHFVFGIGNRHELVVLLARMSVLAITLLAGIALVCFSRRVWGPTAGLFCAALYAFEPNLLSHGHLAAWDGLATSTMTLSWLSLSWWAVSPKVSRALGCGLALGVALTAKHTALTLGPVFALLLLAYSLGWLPGASQNVRARLRQALVYATLMLLMALLWIGVSYNFSFDYSRYLASVQSIYRLNNASYENYLGGEYRQGPFFSYYLVALAVKTPSTTLGLSLLGSLGLWQTVRRRQSERAALSNSSRSSRSSDSNDIGAAASRWPLLPALLPPAALGAVLLGVTAFNPYQIGIRHVVPVIPCLITLLAAAPLAVVRSHKLSLLAFALAGLGAAETLEQAPHFLAYFNTASGGPGAGLGYVDNSNVDWGQDLVALQKLQRRQNLGRLCLMYNGTASPASYGIKARSCLRKDLLHPVAGTTYAISMSFLHRLRRASPPALAWLSVEPWAMAGRSIALYRPAL